ncbi:3'-5' exonuclease [Candidatus Micrarchaeota archaeon]|nr:3'-5' exonuclease [Candidatus Micrarchaeota archaeon]
MTTVAIDVETTGLGHAARPPRQDAVLQLGIAWREKTEVKTWSKLCNPGKKFLANGRAGAALAVNRIQVGAIQNAEPAKAVAEEFWSKIDSIEGGSSGEPVEFRAYNRFFDEGFLSQKPWSIPRHKWGSCIMQAAAKTLVNADRLKLERAMQMLQIPWFGQAHDAAIDARAALLVHEKISGR